MSAAGGPGEPGFCCWSGRSESRPAEPCPKSHENNFRCAAGLRTTQKQRPIRVPSAPGNANLANYVLKPRVTAERVHSRIHLDPWKSSGFIANASFQGFQGLFFFVEVSVRGGQKKTANIF